jgi:agmatine deiminase
MNKITISLMTILTTFFSCNKEEKQEAAKTEIVYTMPEESDLHEGTWLQWPHQYQYGIKYRDSLDSTWVAITQALVTSEKVHIIAYDEIEKNRIIS